MSTRVLLTLAPSCAVIPQQFATGSARVPGRGFSGLVSSGGASLPFTIESVTVKESVFPRAKTCFNRVVLPLYKAKDDLVHYVQLAVELEGCGFGME